MGVAEEGVLGGGGAAVGQGEHVVAGQQLGQPVGGDVAGQHGHPVAQVGLGGQLPHGGPAGPPQLAGDGERDAGHLAQGPQQHVDALVLADHAQGEQPRRPVVRRALGGRPARQVRREVGDRDPCGTEVGGQGGLLGAVHQDRVDASHQRVHQLPVAGTALVRQHVVGDHDRPRTGAGGAQQRQVRRDDRRDDVHDDHRVEAAQPASGAHPRVGPGPGQRPDGAREGRHVRRAAGHRLLARVQPGRVEVAPRHQRHVVAGLGQVVRQGGRVRRDAALVGVGGADHRHLQRRGPGVAGRGGHRRVRHRLGSGPPGRPAGPGSRS